MRSIQPPFAPGFQPWSMGRRWMSWVVRLNHHESSTMGWGKMLLFGNVGQQMDIEEIREYLSTAIDEINKGDKTDDDQNREIAKLKRRNQELQLYVLSLGRLLAQKGILTEPELSAMVAAVEQASGKE